MRGQEKANRPALAGSVCGCNRPKSLANRQKIRFKTGIFATEHQADKASLQAGEGARLRRAWLPEPRQHGGDAAQLLLMGLALADGDQVEC